MNKLLICAFLLTFTLASWGKEKKTSQKAIAPTPPMGWNSYDAYHGGINTITQGQKVSNNTAECLLDLTTL
jgi:hypothetical protein